MRVTLVLSLLLAARAVLPAADSAVLQIRVLEGEGAVYPAGSRSPRPITVQVTDETGTPVEGAAVSFRLPDEGPGGTFASGMKGEIAVTGAGGKASVWGIVWNQTPGPFQIRVTAVKGRARAGLLISQHLSAAVPGKSGNGAGHAAGRQPGGRSKLWYTVLVITAGAAAGGAAMGLARYSRQPSSSQAAAAAAVEEPPLSVGAPVISIGKP